MNISFHYMSTSSINNEWLGIIVFLGLGVRDGFRVGFRISLDTTKLVYFLSWLYWTCLSFPIEKDCSGGTQTHIILLMRQMLFPLGATEAAQLAGLNQGNTRATSYVYIQYMNVHLNSYFSSSVKKELFGLVVLPGLFM